MALGDCTRLHSGNGKDSEQATDVNVTHLYVQVKTLPRRELLTTGAAFAAALLGAGAARAAGESSATRAITAVTRPQQLKKK